ncbi:hypothetical protein FPY71_07210 [Aureimonas fodinaquatilis]|uniref:Uncharacterized protein n=1 Tax=Aureimonas fodinaquatilis TaxID=2565783 RepID=A0A5B0DWR5_9HYPH|nr:hypothetical protein [Aureimonas fodinaquatilis]KAA0970305.1 hypothetical protein FPY71_07210 [Aureimonas fodinaquatilis]
MANHSPNRDNYVAKKTWDEAMSGEAAKPAEDANTPEPTKNEARKNGGGAKAQPSRGLASASN